MSTAIVIAIGNSDDKLTQAEWARFYAEVDERVTHYAQYAGFDVYGRWHSLPHLQWQNAAWSVGVADEVLHMTRDLKCDLREVLREFGQDSMAWTTGSTELVPALPPKPEALQSVSGRWTCGCRSDDCRLKWEIFTSDGRAFAVLDCLDTPVLFRRVSCLTHKIHGDSLPTGDAFSDGGRSEAQAMLNLDIAHQEQCR